MCDVSVHNVNSTTVELMVNSQKVIINLPEITVNRNWDILMYSTIFLLFVVHFFYYVYFIFKYHEKVAKMKSVSEIAKIISERKRNRKTIFRAFHVGSDVFSFYTAKWSHNDDNARMEVLQD